MAKKILNIHYNGEGLEKLLSNLYPYDFKIDGIKFASMEGFLQSLKTPSMIEQQKIWKLHGIDVWKHGQKFNNWKETQTLHWLTKSIKRDSEEYQQLITMAYDCLFENENFKQNLKNSIGYKLIHNINNKNYENKNDITQTVLTPEEYIGNLERLRKKLKWSRFFNIFS